MKNIQSALRTYAIIGAALEVHNIIGPGHLEAVYHECLEIEFQKRKIEYNSKPQLNIYYKEKKYKNKYKISIMKENSIYDFTENKISEICGICGFSLFIEIPILLNIPSSN